MPFRLRLTALAALVVFALATALVPAFGLVPEGGDLNVFYDYGTQIVEGATPYKDVQIEYPPGALAPIVTPAIGSPAKHTYADRFVWGAIALVAATILMLARRPRAAFLVALAPLLLGPVLLKRFDVLPMLLTLIALELALRKRYAWSGAALGVGAAVKLYPVLLLPVLLFAGGRRALAGFAAACGAIFLPFLVIAPHGVLESIWKQVGRHLQWETPLASLALLAHSLGIVSIGLISEANTYAIGGKPGFVLAALTTVLFLAALAVIWRRLPHLVRTREGIVLAWAATLAVAVTLGHVLSPQYLIWLLPFVPLLGFGVTAVYALALILTNIWYPAGYVRVETHMERGDILLLVARNAVLIALVAVLLVKIEPRLRRVRPGRR
jgi:Glycosyltransferase family 87